ncbi:MAG: DNA helicase RecQ [Candidatus Omnitrophota bacterium]
MSEQSYRQVPVKIKEAMYQALKQYWGYSAFRPLQEVIVGAVLNGEESLTVLPTGGGKSLCYQLPALLVQGMAVIISPLISLMKDQVDSLREMGIAAAYLNSSLLTEERVSLVRRIKAKEIKLLYISPEGLQKEGMIDLLQKTPLSFFVIDEAHCISHWGHDFREDYRNLKIIKQCLPNVNLHAFTATATIEVQRDIIEQLQFQNHRTFVSPVDRINLTYRVKPRAQLIFQLKEILEKHPNEPGIVYCLRRDDVDRISLELNELGYKNLPYHAGLSDERRHRHQDAFLQEEVDIIVATIAFGMGIDRSNIRFIIHAAMPKSIEHYQQETGRAGRDGLPAYCYMFYGGGDYRTWSFFAGQSPNRTVMLDKLNFMYNFCSRPQCKHQALTNYFGQSYEKHSCNSCDYCLGEVEMVEDPLDVGQKILSCVEHVKHGENRGFGAGYIANLLKGNLTEQIERWGHHHLPAFGTMAEKSLAYIRYMTEQLIGQGFLQREAEYAMLFLTELGGEVLQGKLTPVLAKPLVAKKKKEISRMSKERREQEWGDIDKQLFEDLRNKRAELAREQNVPAFIIFADTSLKDMAAKMPTTKQAFANVFGVGEQKLKAYAEHFITVIEQYRLSSEPEADNQGQEKAAKVS